MAKPKLSDETVCTIHYAFETIWRLLHEERTAIIGEVRETTVLSEGDVLDLTIEWAVQANGSISAKITHSDTGECTYWVDNFYGPKRVITASDYYADGFEGDDNMYYDNKYEHTENFAEAGYVSEIPF